MEKVILQNKPVGMTPLKIVEGFKNKNPDYESQTISYAGRLDPMAEGLLLLLVGDENKKRNEYENLPKTYETEIIFGAKTDTFDALGLIEKVSFKTPKTEDVNNVIKTFIGKQSQTYPPYSSKNVHGKPLYWWAREGRISEIEIPKRKIQIFNIKMLGLSKISIVGLVDDIKERIKKVNGDFRQEQIIRDWDQFGKKNKGKSLLKLKLEIECSSGTYIRKLTSDIGKKLECGAMCLSIKRTRIGDFTLPKGS